MWFNLIPPELAMADFRANAYAFLLVIVLLWDSIFTVQSRRAKPILVGGNEGWRFGFNYSAWAAKAGRIHVKDTLGRRSLKIQLF